MSNYELTIQIIDSQNNKRQKKINISHINVIDKLWYILYKLDKIKLKEDHYDKAINIFEESLDDNIKYLEYVKYKLLNIHGTEVILIIILIL